MFLNGGFVINLFKGMGLSTATPFTKLTGSTLTYKELEVTQAMLDANNGVVVVPSVSNRDIEFKKPGLKQFDQHIEALSTTFQQQLDSAAVVFENDWANVGAAVAPVVNAPAAPAVTIPEPSHEEPAVVNAEVDLDGEAGEVKAAGAETFNTQD